jgi:hypothetical protein
MVVDATSFTVLPLAAKSGSTVFWTRKILVQQATFTNTQSPAGVLHLLKLLQTLATLMMPAHQYKASKRLGHLKLPLKRKVEARLNTVTCSTVKLKSSRSDMLDIIKFVDIIRAEIVRWVSESLCPFVIVEDQGFKSLMKTGRPEYYLPSR